MDVPIKWMIIRASMISECHMLVPYQIIAMIVNQLPFLWWTYEMERDWQVLLMPKCLVNKVRDSMHRATHSYNNSFLLNFWTNNIHEK